MPRGRITQHIGCKIEGCSHSHSGHGFCAKHNEWLRRGKIDATGKLLCSVRQRGGRKCKVVGCDRKYASKGFCEYHRCQYRRGIIDNDGNSIRGLKCKPSLGKCKIEGCSNKDESHGFCSRHLYQFRKNIIDKHGSQLRPLYDGIQPADPRSQHKKGEDFVLARYFNGDSFCSCPVCGGNFEFYQMDGHHPDRSKKTMSPTKMLSLTPWNKSELLKELDSLVWLCAHCHIATEAGGDDIPYSTTNHAVGKYIDEAMLAILAKKGRQCLDCGRLLGRRTAVFHHRIPAQKVRPISQIAGRYSLDFVLKEADKCDVLCEPCHRRIHRLDKNLRSNKDDRKILLLSSPIGKKTRNGKQGCRVNGCNSKHTARGFCKKHSYQFSVRAIDREGNQLRPLYKGGFGKLKYLRTLPPNMQPPAIPEPNF